MEQHRRYSCSVLVLIETAVNRFFIVPETRNKMNGICRRVFPLRRSPSLHGDESVAPDGTCGGKCEVLEALAHARSTHWLKVLGLGTGAVHRARAGWHSDSDDATAKFQAGVQESRAVSERCNVTGQNSGSGMTRMEIEKSRADGIMTGQTPSRKGRKLCHEWVVQ